jgi:hypothetical protein
MFHKDRNNKQVYGNIYEQNKCCNRIGVESRIIDTTLLYPEYVLPLSQSFLNV